jgi:hypothetical protein
MTAVLRRRLTGMENETTARLFILVARDHASEFRRGDDAERLALLRDEVIEARERLAASRRRLAMALHGCLSADDGVTERER